MPTPLSALVVALGAVLATAGTAGAAIPGPVPALAASDAVVTPVRMKKRPLVRRGGGGTIGSKLGTRTRTR